MTDPRPPPLRKTASEPSQGPRSGRAPSGWRSPSTIRDWAAIFVLDVAILAVSKGPQRSV